MQNKSTGYSIPQWACISLIFISIALFYHKGIDLRYLPDEPCYFWTGALFERNPYLLYIWNHCSLTHDTVSTAQPISVRPLANLIFFLAIKTAGIQQSHVILHLLSRILHFGVAVCAFYLIKRLTRNTLLGLLSALLFATFYLPREILFYTSCIYEQCFTLFGLFTILSYIHHLDSGKPRWYYISLLFFGFAVLSKESAFALIPLIPLLDFYIRNENNIVVTRETLGKSLSPGNLMKYSCYFFLSVVYYLATGIGGCYNFGRMAKELSAQFQLEPFVLTYHVLYDIARYPYVSLMPLTTQIQNPTTKFLVFASIIIIYILLARRYKYKFILLAACFFILMAPLILRIPMFRADSPHATPTVVTTYLYFLSVFSMGMASFIIYFSAETFVRKVRESPGFSAIIVCALFTFVLVSDALNRIGVIHFLAPHWYRSLELLLFFSMSVVFLLSDRTIIRHVLFLVGLALILAFSVNSFGGLELFSIFFFAALIAYYIANNTERLLGQNYMAVQNLRNKLTMRHLVIYVSIYLCICIRLPDYNIIQEEFKFLERVDHLKVSTSQQVRKFLVQNDNKRNLYLLNFPNNLPFGIFDRRLLVWGEFVKYYCNVDSLSVNIYPVSLESTNPGWVGSAGPQISIEKLNELTRDPTTRMLLFNYVKKQAHVIDITGMDYDSVQRLLAPNGT